MAKEKDGPDAPAAPQSPVSVQTVAVSTNKPFAEQLAESRSKNVTAKEEQRAKAAELAGTYRVEALGLSGNYESRDGNEAWAMFCDAHKTWPSPRHTPRMITKVG